ncbi:hypothetical protein NLI96_g7080 [Meripilus lineatus]|uniref:Nucleotidyltransferase family protein n=1 Tax=Meripilus lineatus TaxID=2056292 RepID=A0AAD5V071_9APHY|nr:hypothetical protein NLI96_g7080 [Physisporinus lineatus]
MQTNLPVVAPGANEPAPAAPVYATADLAFLLDLAVQGDIRPCDLVAALSVRFSRMLEGYVDDPNRFREVLDETDSVISGSFVLRFIEGATDWAEGDLDVYVDSVSVDEVEQFLEGEGYVTAEEAQERRIYDHGGGSIREVKKLSKPGTPCSIDLIVSRNKLSVFPIADFWGTQVMNFLTGSSICIAYPHTLNHIAFVVPRRSTDWKVPILVGKYQQRGYEFREFDRERELSEEAHW